MLYNFLQEVDRLANLLRSRTMDVEDISRRLRDLTPQAVRMTITMVVTFPILLVYPFLRRFFVKGIMLGAIKG